MLLVANGVGAANRLTMPMKTFNSHPPIPTIIFLDLGGVLIEDFTSGNRLQDTIQEIGVSQSDEVRFRELWAVHAAPEVCLSYPADNFHRIIEAEFGIKLPKSYSLLQHGFVDHFDPNPSIEPVIARLIGRVKLGLLTNMYPGMLEAIKAKPGLLPTVPWDVVIDSSEVKLQKPDKAIFEYATERAGEPKERILLIDNTRANVDAAAEIGWQTFYYDSDHYIRSSKQLGSFLIELLQ